MKQINLKKLLSAVDIPADWVGIREVYEANTTRFVRDEKPQANTRSLSHGLMVEVLAQGQFGYSASSRMDEMSIAEAARNAYHQALAASKYAFYSFSENARPAHTGSYVSPVALNIDSISAGEINDLLIKINRELKVSDKVISANAYAIILDVYHRFVSSNGSDISQKFIITSLEMQATAQEGSETQTRSNGGRGNARQLGLEAFNEEDALTAAQKVGAQVVELLSAENCPTGTYDLILAPDQMILQIHESIGHALEIDRILGDERNYAGWSFVQLEDFGKLQYGSEIMNVTFDPTVISQLASYSFDDGGLKAEREYIIKNGKLLRGLGARESQIRSGVPGVANFRASSWNRPPIDRMANLNLEPGTSSLYEIISSVEYGIFMETNRSWSIDDYRNKFQFGCEYGRLIENGKFTKTVKNPNYRGVSNSFWASLSKVGNKDTFEIYGTPNCGKGEPNQIIRVGHASPVCLFKNVEIFGGA